MTKLKYKIKSKVKSKIKLVKHTPVFTKNNVHQPTGFCVELREALKSITISEASMLAEMLGVHNQELRSEAGIAMDIQDIECYEGGVKDAADSFNYWFYAGPARTIGQKTNEYTLIKGSVLNWLLDSIMFRMTYDGLKVLHTLGIPL